jgi:uncharacterized protein with PIN domain
MHRDIAIAAARMRFRADPRPGRCFRCERIIAGTVNEFRDRKDFMEYKKTGLCQQCQDIVFTES